MAEPGQSQEPKDQKPRMSYEQAIAAAIRIWNKTPVSQLEVGLEGARKKPAPDKAAQDFLDAMARYIEARKKAGALNEAEDGYFLDVLEEGFRKD